jgi:hypothetical protein
MDLQIGQSTSWSFVRVEFRTNDVRVYNPTLLERLVMKIFALTLISLSGIAALVAALAIANRCEFKSDISINRVHLHVRPAKVSEH